MNACLLHKNPTTHRCTETYSTESSVTSSFCSDLFMLQLCEHMIAALAFTEMFSYLGLFLSHWSLFISFFPSSVLSAFLSFFPHLFFFDIFHPSLPFCIFYILPFFSVPPPTLFSPPSLSYFPSTLFWRRGHMPAGVCCVMLLNISREHSCCTQQAVTRCEVAEVEGWRR